PLRGASTHHRRSARKPTRDRALPHAQTPKQLPRRLLQPTPHTRPHRAHAPKPTPPAHRQPPCRPTTPDAHSAPHRRLVEAGPKTTRTPKNQAQPSTHLVIADGLKPDPDTPWQPDDHPHTALALLS